MSEAATEALAQATLRHAVHSQRYGRGLARKIVALLDEADADLSEQLAQRLARIADGRDNGPATTRRLTEIVNALRGVNDDVYKRIASELDLELTGMAGAEISSASSTLARLPAIGVSAHAVLPSPALLHTIVTTTPIDGFLLSSWTDHMSANRLGRVEKAIRIGLTQGQTIDQIVRRVRGTRAARYTDGILSISKRSAETLVLTANSTIANTAREAVYQENSHLIKQVQWVSTLDSRTSEMCQSRDGKIYPLDDHPSAPGHPRCRSYVTPIVGDYVPATRASKSGPVSGDATMGSWLKDQPEDVVVDLMGRKRAELFRSGKLSFRDFFRDDDTYYTLEELKRRIS